MQRKIDHEGYQHDWCGAQLLYSRIIAYAFESFLQAQLDSVQKCLVLYNLLKQDHSESSFLKNRFCDEEEDEGTSTALYCAYSFQVFQKELRSWSIEAFIYLKKSMMNWTFLSMTVENILGHLMLGEWTKTGQILLTWTSPMVYLNLHILCVLFPGITLIIR